MGSDKAVYDRLIDGKRHVQDYRVDYNSQQEHLKGYILPFHNELAIESTVSCYRILRFANFGSFSLMTNCTTMESLHLTSIPA